MDVAAREKEIIDAGTKESNDWCGSERMLVLDTAGQHRPRVDTEVDTRS